MGRSIPIICSSQYNNASSLLGKCSHILRTQLKYISTRTRVVSGSDYIQTSPHPPEVRADSGVTLDLLR